MVTETFFSLDVRDMKRATQFYVGALGATVTTATERWSSLHIAGVRIGLFHNAAHTTASTGLHFAVRDLAEARAAIIQAGGTCAADMQAAPGVVLAHATDTEGNTFTLRGP